MILRIKPALYLDGGLQAPASKSYSIRAFFVASLGARSLIVNSSKADDVLVARHICSKLGAKLKRIKKNTWQIKGIEGKINFPPKINARESGTSLRFFLAIASLTDKNIKINARGTLLSRPNKPLLEVLRKLGARIKGKGRRESAPIIAKAGNMRPGNISIDGKLSSQFISSLLITLPRLDSKSSLTITGSYIVSRPYIDMTLGVLKIAGIKIIRQSQRCFVIPGRQKSSGLKRFIVPGDYGLAAFIMAAGVLCKSHIIIKGIGKDNLVQADKRILFILRKMGARLRFSGNAIKITGPQKLKGTQLNLRDSPDLVPVTAVLALFAKGKTRIYGIGHVRAKESDRITDLRKELIKTGAKVKEKRDELLIFPTQKLKVGATLNPHNDHRLAMAFSVLGLKLGLRVRDIDCVKKSYPNFLSDLKAIKAQILT
jgi:3-phosphoshikimate 1-carboxyvinyltransferase